MALFRLKISDGTTTINLWDGTTAKLRDGGMQLPPPQADVQVQTSPLESGARLAARTYGARVISLNLRMGDSSLANLRTNLRAIQRLLSDAVNRNLLGHGAGVYLEYQWGDSDGESLFYDILDGQIEFPADFMNATLALHYYILPVKLTLTCKPFGRYATTTLSNETLENCQANYKAQDANSEYNDTDVNLDSTAKWYGQIFTAGANYNCAGAVLLLKKTGSPVATIELWSINAGVPNAMLKSVAIDMAALDGTYFRAYPGIFAAAQALTNGTQYAIIIKPSTADGSNYLTITYLNTATYAGGDVAYTTDSGSSWNTIVGRDMSFATLVASTCLNYQDVDVSANTPEPDIASKMYWKLAPTGATGSKKVWVAKRGGSRQTDDLWTEGEDFTTFTNIIGGGHVVENYGEPFAVTSGGRGCQVYINAAPSISENTEICRVNYTLASPPSGHFRTLVRVRHTSQVAGDYDHIKLGLGYAYGSVTKAPSKASGEYYAVAADNTWEILDLGDIILPPAPASDIATEPSLELRLYLFANENVGADWNKFDIDFIFLLPIDEGCTIVAAVGSTDVLALDGITDSVAVLILNSSDVIQSGPDHVGKVIDYGREDFRLYVLRDDAPHEVTFTSTVKYQGQFVNL